MDWREKEGVWGGGGMVGRGVEEGREREHMGGLVCVLADERRERTRGRVALRVAMLVHAHACTCARARTYGIKCALHACAS